MARNTGSSALSSKPLTRFAHVRSHEFSRIDPEQVIVFFDFLRRPPAGRNVQLVLARWADFSRAISEKSSGSSTTSFGRLRFMTVLLCPIVG